jgi:hypothetical protein
MSSENLLHQHDSKTSRGKQIHSNNNQKGAAEIAEHERHMCND